MMAAVGEKANRLPPPKQVLGVCDLLLFLP